jgi:enoyl-CoA hydratase/carnithine racemase
MSESVNNSDEGSVLFEHIGAVATLTLARPASLNALTWTMYKQLETYLERLANDESVHVVIMRGAGKAFAAGTDITQLQHFNVTRGLKYERQMEAIFEKVAHFPRPTIAAVHGYAVGAGLLLAAACDLRYATHASFFGVPIARTLGNALSLKNYQRLEEAFGPMRAKELLYTARLFGADEALRYGFLTDVVEEEQIFSYVFEVARQISAHAPLTLWAAKEANRRLHGAAGDPSFDDAMTRIYASQDFAEGVRAHVEKRKPRWQGK